MGRVAIGIAMATGCDWVLGVMAIGSLGFRWGGWGFRCNGYCFVFLLYWWWWLAVDVGLLG